MSETLVEPQYQSKIIEGNEAASTALAQLSREEQAPKGFRFRNGELLPFDESQERFENGVLDFKKLLQTAWGISWKNKNPDDVAGYAFMACTTNRPVHDGEWALDIGELPELILSLRIMETDANDQLVKGGCIVGYKADNYGEDEDWLLSTIVCMSNIDKFRNE